MNNQEIAEVYEALVNAFKYKKEYIAFLKVCRTKEEAIEAFHYFIKMTEELEYEKAS